MERRQFMALFAGAVLLPVSARGAALYGPGVTDTAIKIGNTMPYSGPASALSTVGKVIAAYFRKIDNEGGINGRKLEFISYDDGLVPSKTVEQVRRLVESDEVLAVFSSLGTGPNAAVLKYMNVNKVPQLFVVSGATEFNDPALHPWTIGWQPTSADEAAVYARYLVEHYPEGKVGILSEDDEFGRDYFDGLRDRLSGKISVVSSALYSPTDSTVDSQIVTLKSSGADILFTIATPKFAAQAIRKLAELDWKPVHIVIRPSSSVGAVLKPAGLANSEGVLSSAFTKDPTDPSWKNDPDVGNWSEFMSKYYPEGDRNNSYTVIGYCLAQTLIQVLNQCGDDLTRENVMRQSANLNDVRLGMLLPGISLNTSKSDYYPIKQLQMKRFNGERWELFGQIYSPEKGRR
jgi:branched-chain amino acid transport system substrate-binding protein